MPEDVFTSLPKGAKIISDDATLTTLPKTVRVLEVESPDSISRDFGSEKLDPKAGVDEIVANIPDLDDAKKQIIKDLALRGVKDNELSEAIVTLQGKHHKQAMDGSTKYYMDDKGIPRPLANSERPPKNYEIASKWGTQTEADDDAPLTTIAKQIYNILPSVAENAIDLVHLPYGAIAGEEADWYKSLKNSANYLKMSTSEASKKPLLNSEGIDEFSDIFDPNRWEFTADNVAGTIGQIVKSVGEFAVGGGAITKTVGATTKLGKGASLFTASYATQLGETIDRAKQAGLDTDDAYRVSAAINVPIAMVDLAMGVEGRIFKDQTAQAGRKQLVDNLVAGFIKDSEGKITKEGLDELFKSTIVANTALVKNWGKQTAADVVGEGSQEALQQFVQNAGEQLYDKLSDAEKAKFGTNAFSPKAFAEYLQEGIAGALGGAPSGLAYNKIKQITKDNEQSKTAFGLVQRKEGESIEDQNIRINAYKANIENEVKQGKITRQEADNAYQKINSYKEYAGLLQDYKIDDANKRKIFDLSFQKQNLINQLVSDAKGKNIEDLNPIDQALYRNKEKMAKDLQKEIDELILKPQAQEELSIGEKTAQDIIKKDNPVKKEGESKKKVDPIIQAILDRNKKEASKKEAPEEKRSYEEITTAEFNKPTKITGGYRTIHKKAVEFLEKQPNKTVVGGVVKLPFEYGGKKNNTYGVQMPDGKIMRFSSSMERPEGFRGHMRTEHLVKDEELEGFPIGLKVEEIPALEEGDKPKKVIKAFNANTGKFVGYMKETNTGKNTAKEYSAKQIDYLEDLGTKLEPPIEGVEIPAKPQPNKPVPVKDFVKQNIEALKQDEDSDYDPFLEESGIYERYFTEQYEKQFGKEAIGAEEAVARPVKEGDGQGVKSRKGVKGTPKARRKIKDPRYKKVLQIEPNTPHEAVLQYFIGGGKINSSAIRELYKNPNKEILARVNYLNKNAPSIEGVAHYIWEQFDQRWDDVDIRNEVENVVNGYLHPSAMAEALLEAHNENKFTPNEQVMIQAMQQAEAAGLTNQLEDVIDQAETKTDEQLSKDETWEEIKDIIVRKEGDEDVFQQGTERSEADITNVVERIQKAMPSIKVVYDTNLDAKGKWSPKSRTLTVNPYYATKDTPIHEAGHILIDAMGGYSNRVIRAGIEQLKTSPLWKEIAVKYPISENYTEEDLGKEVLAEAIGREGAGIFDDVAAQTRFKQILNYIFDWLKRNLGLEKNIAKNLAKQIISGVNVDRAVGGKEQLQQKITFDEFRKSKGVNIEQEQSDLEALNDALETEEDEDVVEQIEAAISVIEDNIENDRAEFQRFQNGIGEVSKIANAESLDGFTLDQLLEAYDAAKNYGGFADKEMLNDAKSKIAVYLNNKRSRELEEKFGKEITEYANTKDLRWRDVWFRTLGHITEDFPALQELNNIFDQAFMDMQIERNDKKSRFEKLGRAVVAEYNKKMGVVARLQNVMTSNSAKYFDFVDDNGKLRTNTAGLTKAQKDFLELYKELLQERNKLAGKEVADNDLEIIKTDKGFGETFKNDGFLEAMSMTMGGANNMDTEVTYTDPKTNRSVKASFMDAQKAIISHYKKDKLKYPIALAKLLVVAYKARKAGESGIYSDYKGKLTSKFDKPQQIIDRLNQEIEKLSENPTANAKKITEKQRQINNIKNRSYSKDFYAAGMSLIDDITHVKHMNKFVPLTDSIELFYEKLGFGKDSRTKQYIQNWRDLFVYQRKKDTDPILDYSLRTLRGLTSKLVMAFNLPANVLNVAIGNINNIRKESWALVAKGNKRLIADGGGLSKKGLAILDKYNIIQLDFDSNPKVYAGKLLDFLAYGLQRWGEKQIQGSMFLGQLTDDEWKDLEYKDGKLTYKGNETELKKKFNQYQKLVTDVQGKYGEKERRAYMMYEYGKALGQFRTFMPDWWKERFGDRYIDSNNVEHIGSWRTLNSQAFADLRADLNKLGLAGTSIKVWNSEEYKNFRTNVKGLMFIAAMFAWKYSDDDDEKKRQKAGMLENAIGQMLFIFDPHQLKYTVTSPAAAVGTLGKMIDVVEDLTIKQDGDKAWQDFKKVIPYNKLSKVPSDVEKMLGSDNK